MNLTWQWHNHSTGVVSNIELHSVASNSKSKPEPLKQNFHPPVSHTEQQLKGRSEEVFSKEADFKRQRATATDTTVHVTLFYSKEKITSKSVFISS